MNIEQEKMIVEALPSLYPLQEFEKKAIHKVIDALPSAEPEKRTETHDVCLDAISRQAAIEAVQNRHIMLSKEKTLLINDLKKLPPTEPVIVPCDYVKACNEATMDKLTSAVLYLDVLEELKKHGYVLVDMREVTE